MKGPPPSSATTAPPVTVPSKKDEPSSIAVMTHEKRIYSNKVCCLVINHLLMTFSLGHKVWMNTLKLIFLIYEITKPNNIEVSDWLYQTKISKYLSLPPYNMALLLVLLEILELCPYCSAQHGLNSSTSRVFSILLLSLPTLSAFMPFLIAFDFATVE